MKQTDSNKFWALVSAVLVLSMLPAIPSAPAAAGDATTEMEIKGALIEWMAHFNAGRTDRVCELFAPELRANFRGQPSEITERSAIFSISR